jgi:nucleotide-binding universal stress UspA family protein
MPHDPDARDGERRTRAAPGSGIAARGEREGQEGAPYARVLCATDLSPMGDAAVRVAVALTAPGGVLSLLHVYEPTYSTSPLDASYHVRYAPTPDDQREIERHVRRHLAALRPENAGRPDVRVEEILLHHENVPAAIAAQALETGAQAVVVGTHGRTGLGRLFLGSVAMDVLKRLRVPLVLFHDPGRADTARRGLP